MANSPRDTLERLDKLEQNVGDIKGAIVQMTHVLVDQSERMDAGFRAVRNEIHDVRVGVSALHQDFEHLRHDVQDLQGGFRAVTDRLDRLIEVTTKERTQNYERIVDLEQRVTKLEQKSES